MAPYRVNGVLYQPHPQPHYDEVGVATWYGAQYHRHATADGELFDMDKPSAAHTTLPLPSIVEVTNLENGRRIRVRVNDRGPFVRGRIIDLSREGAKELGFYAKGSARVRVRYVGPAPRDGSGSKELAALAVPAASAVTPGQAPPPPLVAPSASIPVASASGGPRVQVGAFSDRANAVSTQAALENLGEVSLSPVAHGSRTLWRVIVQGPPHETASSLVSALAASGYRDAKILAAN